MTKSKNIMNRTPEYRFWGKIDLDFKTGCWNWQTGRSISGYGIFWYKGKQARAHRISYQLFKGLIPKDLTIDHLCRNRCCVNPNHLEAVTIRENVSRSPRSNMCKTHCKHGHEFTRDNTYIYPNDDRECRTCNRNHMRKVRELQRSPRTRLWNRKRSE